MTRTVEEWRGKDDDAAIPPRVQVRICLKYGGKCAKCGRSLQPKRYALDHIVALVNGGANAESNLQPLCNSPCHSDKTRLDVALKSKTYRIQSKNLGIRKRGRTIPGRRFDGTPIPSRARG